MFPVPLIEVRSPDGFWIRIRPGDPGWIAEYVPNLQIPPGSSRGILIGPLGAREWVDLPMVQSPDPVRMNRFDMDQRFIAATFAAFPLDVAWGVLESDPPYLTGGAYVLTKSDFASRLFYLGDGLFEVEVGGDVISARSLEGKIVPHGTRFS